MTIVAVPSCGIGGTEWTRSRSEGSPSGWMAQSIRKVARRLCTAGPVRRTMASTQGPTVRAAS